MTKIFNIFVLALEEADVWTANYCMIPHLEKTVNFVLWCAVGTAYYGKPGYPHKDTEG